MANSLTPEHMFDTLGSGKAMPPRAANTGGVENDYEGVALMQDYTTTSTPHPWFRLYNTLIGDPRIRRKPLHIRWAWIAILTTANCCTRRGYLPLGYSVIDLADEANISEEQAQEALDYFMAQELLEQSVKRGNQHTPSTAGALHVAGWERKQFHSDSSTARVKKHRSERSNTKRSTERSTDVSCNADVTPPDNRVQSKEREYDEAFEKWWSEYPRKVGKGAARKAFRSALKKVDLDTLTASTTEFAERCKRDKTEAQFIPHPSTWLNAERWSDDTIPFAESDDDGWSW